MRPIRILIDESNLIGLPNVVSLLKNVNQIAQAYFQNVLRVIPSSTIAYPNDKACNFLFDKR